jgi:hypothetical protein
MPRRHYVLLILTVLAGAWLRLWQLATIPPGLHYDTAAYALLSRAVAFEGYRPIFVPAYAGREVLFIYWIALWYRLIGSSVFTLRLCAALVGVLTIPACFFALRQVLRSDPHGLALAVFGTVLMSVALFHVIFSRFGFRVITQPLTQCLTLGFLFRGLGRVGKGSGGARAGPDFALAGAFTGLTAHTYVGARFFVLPVAVFWLVLLVGVFFTRRSAWPRYLTLFGLFGLSALIVFAPLGWYFWQHPADFFIRASQVVVRPDQMDQLAQSALAVAKMVFLRGDPYYRYNIPLQPLLDPLTGLLFVTGLLATLYSLFRPPANRAHGWTHAITLLAWMPLMLIPAIISVNEIVPSNVRAFGVIPLLYALPARGLGILYHWLRERFPASRPLSPRLLPGLSLAVLLVGLVATGRDYFVTWLGAPNQYVENEGDISHLSQYLNEQPQSDAALFVASLYYQDPSIAYLARDYEAIRWLSDGTALDIPEQQAAVYLFPRSAPAPAAWVASWAPHQVAAPPGPDGIPDFYAYRFEAGQMPPLPSFTPLVENFANIIFLKGYRVETDTDQLNVDLLWHVENLPDITDLLPYVRLYDPTGDLWSQSGNFTYPSGQWAVGDTLVTRLRVPVPTGWTPGTYTLKAGIYSEAQKTSLPHLNPAGAFAGERAVLGPVWLPGHVDLSESAFRSKNAIVAPAENSGLNTSLALLGAARLPDSIRQGERLPLTLFWYARSTTQATSISITLGGRPVLTPSTFLARAAGQAVMEHVQLRLPLDLPPGPAELQVTAANYGTARLATLNVVKVERNFTQPAVEQPASVSFQNQFAFTGYTLSAGSTTQLTLTWKSLAATDLDYTVFVHILDTNGQVVAQTDQQPQNGAYPTSLWAPGEFVSDTYTFNLPPGTYSAELGLYVPETGERLAVTSAAGQPPSDKGLLPEFNVK